jgi:predicted alpha/beta superfamily hydrolase
LKPWVRERFSVNPDDSTFFGFSRGGIFGAYVLLTEPDLFARFGIGSPSLHLDGELIFDLEAHYASTYDDLAAKVFFSVGEYENSAGEKRWVDHHTDQLRAAAESIAEEEPFDIIADARRLVERLQSRRYPSLAIDFEVLPREYHHTAPPLALSRSLRYLLDAPS